jgi:hypothetical protein
VVSANETISAVKASLATHQFEHHVCGATGARMLTLFSAPKSFVGHFDVIQRNAIASWTRLHPAVEIILFGDEEGAGAVAQEYGVRHEPAIERNEFGTPLLSDLFLKAREVASHRFVGLVNTDIILLSDFASAFRQVVALNRRFLMVGQRRNIIVNEPLHFDSAWEKRVRTMADRTGNLNAGVDYFVFPKDLWGIVPPFAIGRLHWDGWPLFAARQRKAVVIDATGVVLAIHQAHDYAPGTLGGVETERNQAMMAGAGCFTMDDASHRLTAQGLRPRCRSCHPVCVCNPLSD